MIRKFHRSLRGRGPVSGIARPCRLSCVWIETGNPRQPLASVWIDEAMRAFTGVEEAADHDPWPLCA
jgi:hypothetical protein